MALHVMDEANHCLGCKVPRCQQGCPIHTNIPEVIRLLKDNKLDEAGRMLFENNPLTTVCSLVCNHEKQCEGHCVRGIKGAPVHFSVIENYISSTYASQMTQGPAPSNGKKAAIIGSGPAGLTIAVILVTMGGQLSTMVTDCVQGIFSYWVYALLVAVILTTFSMSQFRDVMLARPPGESFINPFDTGKLTDFNILFVFISIFAAIYSRMAWQGNSGYNSAGASPHEQKMGGVLGVWRNGFQTVALLLLVFGAYVYMNHADFASQAAAVNAELSQIRFDSVQTTQTIREQMTVPVALRSIFPVGVTGVFCALALFLMRTFFLNVPKELEEAARIDGASDGQIVLKIVMPLAKPSIITTALQVLIYVWNEYIYATTFLTGESKYTLAAGLNALQATEMTGSWPVFAAAAITVSLPVLAIFFLCQKYMTSGLTAGGVKG